ncbi:hypothetical protein EDC01DRAFT_272691 [Geopyxis carbonaria]|nr:hypothetical protein EDC01DRAFT_272691 [Geopyxis carbonaria]
MDEETGHHVIHWAMFGLAFIFTAIRGSTRLFTGASYTLDDLLAFASCATLAGLTALYSQMIPLYADVEAIQLLHLDPLSLHLDDAIASKVSQMLKLSFIATLLFWAVLWLVKFSILAFFRRFLERMPTYIDGWYIVSAFCAINLLGCVLIQFLTCAPFSSTFIGVGPHSCQLRHPGNPGQLYGTTILDVVSDIMIIALPFPLIFGLRVATRKKVALGILFALGLIIIVFAIIRATQVASSGKGLIGATNFFWLGIWSQAEAAVAVAVASLPQLWTVWSHFYRKGHSSYNRSKSGGAGAAGEDATARRATMAAQAAASRATRDEDAESTGSEVELNKLVPVSYGHVHTKVGEGGERESEERRRGSRREEDGEERGRDIRVDTTITVEYRQ